MKEIWKDIKGYEGLYSISNMGRVKRKEKLLKGTYDGKGYKMVTLYKDGVRKRYSVHRLVAYAYIPNPENKPYIDHINTIRDDNRVENLRWVTPKENCNNPITLALMSAKQKEIAYWKGKTHSTETKMKIRNALLGRKKPKKERKIYQYSKYGTKLIKVWKNYEDIEKEMGIKRYNIYYCLTGKTKRCAGYIWK